MLIVISSPARHVKNPSLQHQHAPGEAAGALRFSYDEHRPDTRRMRRYRGQRIRRSYPSLIESGVRLFRGPPAQVRGGITSRSQWTVASNLPRHPGGTLTGTIGGPYRRLYQGPWIVAGWSSRRRLICASAAEIINGASSLRHLQLSSKT